MWFYTSFIEKTNACIQYDVLNIHPRNIRGFGLCGSPSGIHLDFNSSSHTNVIFKFEKKIFFPRNYRVRIFSISTGFSIINTAVYGVPFSTLIYYLISAEALLYCRIHQYGIVLPQVTVFLLFYIWWCPILISVCLKSISSPLVGRFFLLYFL